jgi:hypothetical protein
VLFVAEVQAWDEEKGELGEATVAGCLGVKVKQLPTEVRRRLDTVVTTILFYFIFFI